MHRTSKVVDLETAVSQILPGSSLATGGLGLQNKPCAFVRAVVKRRTGNLTLFSSPLGSYDVDLLVGADLVRESYVPAVSFDALSLAPSYTRALLARTVQVVATSESLLLAGYLATHEGTPYHLVSAVEGTASMDSPLLTALFTASGERLYAAKALAPDLAVIHVQEADCFGNGRHMGGVFADRIIAGAAKQVILTTDRLIAHETVRAEPYRTTIPSYMVSQVVHLPRGAHPCSSHGLYGPDDEHLRSYIDRGKTAAGFTTYLAEFIDEVADHAEYLRRCHQSPA